MLETFIREWWPVMAGLLAHFWRTESSRVVMQKEIETLKERQGQDRQSTQAMFSEIRDDLKTLIAKVGE